MDNRVWVGDIREDIMQRCSTQDCIVSYYNSWLESWIIYQANRGMCQVVDALRCRTEVGSDRLMP